MRLLVLALIAAVTPTWALGASVAVNIDQASRITLGHPAHDVIVGNPGIADVTLLDGRHLLVTGKSYGVTNLVVTDQAGRTMLSRQIIVGSPSVGEVSLHRGMEVADFACSPRCERTSPSSAAPTASSPQPAP